MAIATSYPLQVLLGLTWTTLTTQYALTFYRFQFCAERGVSATNFLLYLSLLCTTTQTIIGTYETTWVESFVASITSITDIIPELDKIALSLRMAFFTQYIYYTSMYLCKAAFLTQYWPLFDVKLLGARTIFWCGVVYVASCYIATTLYTTLAILPVSKNWDPIDPHIAYWQISFATPLTVLNLTSDLVIMLLPLYLLSQHGRLTRAVKIVIALVVFMGLFSIVSCVVRFAIFWTVRNQRADKNSAVTGPQGASFGIGDVESIRTAVKASWASGTAVGLWQGLEVWAGYVAACMPKT